MSELIKTDILIKSLPESKFFKKKKLLKYKLRSSNIDRFGTRIDWYEKKTNAKSIDTLKLYYPKIDSIIKETNDLCNKCKEGYLILHPTIFKDETVHIQSSCNKCHRFNCYIKQE